MKSLSSIAFSLALAVPGTFRSVAAAPGPAEYALQLGSSYQYQSNPARLAEASSDIRSANVLVKAAGLGLRLPLLSEDTRLDIGGTFFDASYSRNRQLNHQPHTLKSSLSWRAGRLFAGKFSFGHQKQLNLQSSHTWPKRDLQTLERKSAEIGMRITERLVLPAVQVFENVTRYEHQTSQALYNRKDEGVKVFASYAGLNHSNAEAGFRYTRVNYGNRAPAVAAMIDKRYDDMELFVSSRWGYSPKFLLQAQLGVLERNYEQLRDRDVRLFIFEGNAIWHYSPKTRLSLRLWHRPYINDDDPFVLYSMQTNVAASVIWRPTVKTAVQLGAEFAKQRNTAYLGRYDETQQLRRYGVRLQWQQTDNLRWLLDVYQDRQHGATTYSSYKQSFVRIGLEYTWGSHRKESLRPLMQPAECEWRRSSLALCDPTGVFP